MATRFPRSNKRARVWLATLLVFSMTVYVSSAMAVDGRMERRAAEMPLPDPYLDPTWPEEVPSEGLGERYEAGDSDNVEDVPLDDEEELFRADQQGLQALTGEGPPPTEPSAAPPAPAPGGATQGAPGAIPAPVLDNDEILPGDDHREPVEW